MARFKPFHGILPARQLAVNAVSRPFDYYSREELQHILCTQPDTFLQVIVPAIPAEDEKIPYAEKLRLGKQQFEALVQKGSFVRDVTPHYYVYRQTAGEEQYTGIIGAISIDDCVENIVKPHEQTIEHKEEKLKEYLKIIDINAEPVVISYKADIEINEWIDRITAASADYDFDFPGFGHHELWKIGAPDDLRFVEDQLAEKKELYICDGHHRTASSVLLGQEMRREHSGYNGNEAFNYFMVILFPHHQIRLREFNRLVKDLNGLSHDDFIARLQKDFIVTRHEAYPDTTEELYSFAAYLDRRWYHLAPRPGVIEAMPEPSQLPTQVLTDLVLSPILDIHDLRRDKRIAFKGGRTNAAELMQLVDSGQFKAAFTVNKITIPIFKKFADQGWFMPPKSTWFEPKLLNGLVVYSLEGEL